MVKKMLNELKSRLSIIGKALSIFIILQLIVRFILMYFSRDTISYAVFDLIKMFLLGFTFDILVGLYFIFPISLLVILSSTDFSKKKKYIFYTIAFITFAIIVFTNICEYYFWEEFQNRFNFIAVDYLIYTTEVVGNINQSYNMPLLFAITLVITIGIIWLLTKCNFAIGPAKLSKRISAVVVYLLILILGTAILDGKFIEKTSENTYTQEISANGVFQFFHAFFNNELDYDKFYLRNPNTDEVVSKIRTKLAMDGSSYISDKGIYRQITNNNNLTGSKPNIVVIVVESLSSSYMGLYGRKETWTPFLDELAKDSFLYSNVYAIGTRTVRGLEAVSLNVPPTPGQAIVRRPDCGGLHTAGTPLREIGYKTQFLYGGYGYFDNMNTYFEGNGYEIRDRTDIPQEEIFFSTIWGVADEILFDLSIKELDKHYETQQPCMQIIMTTTNHRPFTFPEGKAPNAPQGKREGVVKYTDWSIVKFINDAKSKPWFDNTIFVITADHNSSAAGEVTLPVNKYKIPCIIYAPKLIEPGKNNRLMSQIDIMPTLFGMLGLSYKTKNMGYDINKLPEGEERIFISTYQLMGYIHNDKLVILSPQRRVQTYKIDDYKESGYTKIDNDPQLTDEAVTWYQSASYLYKNSLLKEKE